MERAPARGRYDRRATPSERAHDQRQLITAAVAVLLVEHAPNVPKLTVSDICEHTGLARNTLYGHFDGVDAVLRAVIDDATRTLLSAVSGEADVSTPLDTVRAFAAAWSRVCAEHPLATQVALRWDRPRLHDELKSHLVRVIAHGVRAGTFSTDARDLRPDMLVAATLEAGRSAATQRQHSHVAAALTELLIRTCR